MNKITDAEMVIMKIVWHSDVPITSSELLKKLPENKWKITTILTLASRLIDKGFLRAEKSGRILQYYPVMGEADYKKLNARNFLDEMYEGSIKNFFAALYPEGSLNEKDMEDLKEILLKKEK